MATATRIGSNSPTAIQTFSGVFFDPFSPDPELICIEDIAHALSQQCRFSGHTRRLYSVAEHCIRVADLCPPEYKLEGLLHDAAEAYLVDLPRPIKHTGYFRKHRDLEARTEYAIAERFGLCFPWPQPVKQADNLMLWAEAEALMHGTQGWLADRPKGMDDEIADLAAQVKGRPYGYRAAEEAFLTYFKHLYRGKGAV